MHASECRRYAEICSELVWKSSPTHQPLLLEMAEKWLKAARELEREQDQHGARGADPRR